MGNITECFNFLMELGEFGQVSSKQKLISSLSRGARLQLIHIRTQNSRYGYFEVLYDNKKIGVVPPEVTPKFFKNGVLQNNRCLVGGLVPKGQYTVTCEIRVELMETFVEEMEREIKPSFDEIDLASLPPKRKVIRRKNHGIPPKYIGREVPARKLFFKNELLIVILCVLIPPVGVALLFLFSRRKQMQKAALTAISVCVCFTVFFTVYMVKMVSSEPEIITSNSPERVAMLLAENWQAENWQNFLYLSVPGTTAAVNDIELMFSETNINSFQFTEIYKTDSRATYELEIFDYETDEEGNPILKEGEVIESKIFTFDVIRFGTTWYVDLKSFNHELFYEPLEDLFASDSHVVIEPVQSPTVYLDTVTLTYHYRVRCAPDGAPSNTLNDALRKGYGPCYRCAR